MSDHPHITLQADVPCATPDDLTPGQRKAMVAYKDTAACKRDYLDEIEQRRRDSIRFYGQDDDPLLGFDAPKLKEPHAVLVCKIRGYVLYHNPNEINLGCFLDCVSERDRARAIETLGASTTWHVTRYLSGNTRVLVRGFE